MTEASSKTARERGKTWRTIYVVTAALIWLAIPAGAAGYLLLKSSQVDFPPEHQVWASPKEAPSSVEEQTGLVLSWADPADIVAPAWSGIVQRSDVEPGQQLVSGATVAKIDGIERIAYSSPEPFIRTLSLADQGPDVAQLNDLLASRDLSHTPGDDFSWETRIGVEELAESLGAGKNVTSFDPAWVVFLASSVRIEKIELAVGAPAPTEGTVIATGFPQLASAHLTTFASAKELLTEDKSTGVPPPLAAPADSTIMIGDHELALAEDRSSIATDSLPTIETAVSGGSRATIARTLSPGVEGWSLPTVAVYIDPQGESCVLVRTKGTIRTERVAVVSTQDQTAVVTGHLSAGDEVAMDPSADPRSCS